MKKRVLLLFIIAFIFAFNYLTANENNVNEASWLFTGPFKVTVPTFSKINDESYISNFLDIKINKIHGSFYPKEGNKLFSAAGESYEWRKINDLSKLFNVKTVSCYYLAKYIKVNRFLTGSLIYKGEQPIEIFVDEKKIISKKDYKKSLIEKKIKLLNGKHLILSKVLVFPNKKTDKKIEISFSPDIEFKNGKIESTLNPERVITLKEILDVESPVTVDISPTGKYLFLMLKKRIDGKTESWVEIRETKTGKIIKSYKGFKGIGDFKWNPIKGFSFVKWEKSTVSLYFSDIIGDNRLIYKAPKEFQDYYWTPDGEKIIFSVGKKVKEYINGVKRLLSTEDRQRGNRNKRFLYLLYVKTGIAKQISAGKSVYLSDINKAGDKIIFSTTDIDYKTRPYIYNSFYILDLNSMKRTKLFDSFWINTVEWLNKNNLIILGGADSFNGAGRNLKKDVIANDFDIQAYIYNIKTKQVQPITKSFKPSIDSIVFKDYKNKIFFSTTDRSYKTIYSYDLVKKRFSKIDTGSEIVRAFSVSKSGNIAVFIGNNSNTPPKVFSINLKKHKIKTIYFPAKEDFSKIKFGKVENWNFKNKEGDTIIGRIYYPPDFDKNKKYPAIIYYYGGTSPVDRSFGGRYPKNYWAANGYVVYVLQPRGATGFGQKFSSYHVNDWGKYSAKDILQGAEKFLKAHPFVKKDRVGILGASYGGFMTEFLITKTDMFAAAISHAGISLLPHYWGEGYWGYSYSAIATANSFPWNRKDIYVRRSPLFNADKIHTPLLLLHGSVDTNVPTGESDQLYTALKLLGRPVEYIKIKNQNHWIMEYGKRKIWSRTIIAWFDRWLKNQPQFWNSLYKN